MQFMCFRPSVFPFKAKNETVSQSVTAWKVGKALDLSAPRLEAIAWAAVYLKCFPVPNATHSSSTFISSTTEIASTTTSVSAIRIIIFFSAWRNTRVSASSWVHPLIMVQVYFCGWWDHAVTACGDEYFARNWSSFIFLIYIFVLFCCWKKAKQVTFVLIVLQEALPGGR